MAERWVRLCDLQDLSEGTSRGFSVATAVGKQAVFLVKKAGCIAGYINSCPHTGAPLDWVPDQFLSQDGELIQCATHDARFRIEDGLCVAGPCVGRRLKAIRTASYGMAVYAVLATNMGEP